MHSVFTNQIKRWNNDVYGHISTRKKFLTRKLQNIEVECDKTNSAYLNQVELDVREELENVFHLEEVIWK